ncbi:hypothetical protein FPZ24_00900 [Sphingomonas panacisoli]|uniref:Uncharacterized protein n=1 Tax=Sphingomonas panacisoli TaxID=1813879 RepID=A0A5B8LDM8_9SPHN|nr:hypothetical protein [Sphingomonas panacisoli]QDZ06207.1 hypothetical protein FPZ24_00900 [Sphingomonas panacisoli]
MKYVRVVQWATKGDTVQLEMLGEDEQTHTLEVSTDCAGALVAALASEAEKFNAQGKDQQMIRPTGLQTGKTADGEPVILMTLKGGTELPLVFKAESLSVLISELQGLMGSLQQGSQIRWQ